MLVRVCTCQNVKLLEISCRGSLLLSVNDKSHGRINDMLDKTYTKRLQNEPLYEINNNVAF